MNFVEDLKTVEEKLSSQIELHMKPLNWHTDGTKAFQAQLKVTNYSSQVVEVWYLN